MDSILDLLFGGLKKIGPYVLKNILRNLFRWHVKQYRTKVSGRNLATLSAQLGTSKNLSFLEVSSYMK